MLSSEPLSSQQGNFPWLSVTREWPSPPRPPEVHRGAKLGGAFNQVANPRAPFSGASALCPPLALHSLGLCGNRTQQKTHSDALQKPTSGSMKF